MSQTTDLPRRRRRLPLAVRLSFILILAAVVPLMITLFFSERQASQALTNQASQSMATDANTRIQLIDRYFTERMLDTETLTQVSSTISFVATPPVAPVPPTSPQYPAYQEYQNAALHASYALIAGKERDNNYIIWGLYDAHGNELLAYPQNTKPYRYGQYLIPPEQLKEIQNDKTGQAFLSPVYYNASIHKAFVDIYAPIYADGTPKSPYIGFMRASLDLDYIWGIVQDDRGIGNSGSSFILDQNGVRIADTNSKSSALFTTVAPLAPTLQQQITSENWYGQNGNVPQDLNQTLAGYVMGNSTNANSFSLTLGNTDYQVGEKKATTVPWTYFVISPNNIVTQAANQQITTTITVAVIVALIAALLGLLVSGRITRPIMRSVDQLRENSEALNVLAKKQQSASSEQLWVVDSVQVGLQSVQYYTDATRIAAHRMSEIGMELERNWRKQDIETIKQGLQQVIGAGNYIEKATHYQGDSSQKLSTAIKVTSQVNEQLADGAISATEAASQLEQVVNDLRSVIGQ